MEIKYFIKKDKNKNLFYHIYLFKVDAFMKRVNKLNHPNKTFTIIWRINVVKNLFLNILFEGSAVINIVYSFVRIILMITKVSNYTWLIGRIVSIIDH